MPDHSAADAGPSIATHGAARLTAVTVDAYNAELRSAEGFVGDRASNRAFRAIIEDWRARLRTTGEDPFGDTPTPEISKKKLDRLLVEGEPEAAGLVQASIEEFAQELAQVIRRFLRLKSWRHTERIVIGGGLRGSRIGELAIGRAGVILKAEKTPVELQPIKHDPDHAGLIGCIHLAPSWIFAGHDCILAIDIGGSNIRAGIVELNAKKTPDLSDAKVRALELWRHCDDKPKRDEAVERLVAMLERLVTQADEAGHKLAPFIGIGCPGLIDDDGAIKRGGQNLPGNWQTKSFNLPQRLRALLPTIGSHATTVLMHNDAVVQGLSQIPFCRDVERWGVMTIGTGLGNARFTNRETEAEAESGGAASGKEKSRQK